MGYNCDVPEVIFPNREVDSDLTFSRGGTNSINPNNAFKLLIVNLQLPSTHSKAGQVSHHGTMPLINDAAQVTIKRAPNTNGMSRNSHPIKRIRVEGLLSDKC